jgi:hypothetical protein
MESEADRLAMIQAVGGEPFTTDKPAPLLGVFEREPQEALADGRVVSNYVPILESRSSDVAAHGLMKGSAVIRQKDGAQYVVRDLLDDGTGMTRLVLGK